MKTERQQLGDYGENLASDYLKNKGYQIVSRNWKNKWGEIDIVAKKDDALAFVEVKTIHSQTEFSPFDEIDFRKQRQLIKMARIYLSKQKLPLETAFQIDLIGIEKNTDGPKIIHLENAIEDIY